MQRLFPVFLAFFLIAACTISESDPAPTPTPLPLTPLPRESNLPAPPEPPPLAWSGCGGSFQCASLLVPLDYADPTGRQIEVPLIRLRARNEGQRIGSLVFNFGGPGASGVEYLRAFSFIVPGQIRDRFDLVSFDPRGVGGSTELNCHDDLQDYIAVDPSPDNEAEWRELNDAVKAFAELCSQRHGDILPFLGTESVVRDLDQLRRAVGDEKLNYLGYSYGTVIGAVYADLFPGKVRAFVLDGAIDISLPADQSLIHQTLGFEGALTHYLEDCAEKQCLRGYGDNPREAVEELLRRVEIAPIPAPSSDRPLGPGEAVLGLIYPLYSPDLWSALTNALNAALAGNGSQMVSLVDLYLDRNRDGTYANSMEVLLAVNCIDDASSREIEHYEELTAQLEKLAPTFGAATGGTSPCAFWAAEPRPLEPPVGRGAPPILVIGTSGDPATPYAGALAMSQALESGVLLTYYGEGHTAYLAAGDSCIDDAVNHYLLTTEPPTDGAECGDADEHPIIELPVITPVP